MSSVPKLGARAACLLATVAVGSGCSVETTVPSDASSASTSGAAGLSGGGAGAGGDHDGGRAGVGAAGMTATTGGAAGASAGAAATSGSGAGGAGGGGGGSGEGGGDSGATKKSAGCGKGRTLQNGTVNLAGRKYTLRVPDDYDNERAYRLILGFHGATGNSGQVAPSFFGLWPLSEGTTIFVAPDAVNGLWSSATDVAFVDAILAQVEAELCIDTKRIQLEGFSQGGAMSWALACARPNVFRAVVVHSGGGVARPASCEPVAFLSSLGQKESGGAGQSSNSDFFAAQNGCTVQVLPKAPTGGHACSDYQGCLAGSPTRWCDYDGGHTPSPSDAGQDESWMPAEVWAFLKQF